ncbi:peroxisome biogenesis factor 1, N-terminal-domain-containing protein [Scenedesmus sp. NREL 46B-D3]|nr:peroxisome biogenesis factor 1, N-terminal-domain-containing protein [Scenedesmus sp. NREL 46B-D3]
MEFYDSVIGSGAHRAVRARITVVPSQHSWVALPGPFVSSLQGMDVQRPLVIRVTVISASAFGRPGSSSSRQQQPNSGRVNSTAPRYVAWSGDECVPGTIQLSAGLAGALQLLAGTEVQLQALPRLAAAAAVVVEPVSAADWEVVELNAGLLEDMLLSQAGVVCVGQPFPLWARQARVMLRVTNIMHWPNAAAAAAAAAAGGSSNPQQLQTVAKLVPGTELHIAPKPRAVAGGGAMKPGQLPLANGSSGSNSSPAGAAAEREQQQQQQAGQRSGGADASSAQQQQQQQPPGRRCGLGFKTQRSSTS